MSNGFVSYYNNYDRLEILLPMNENYQEAGNYLLVDSCQGGSFYLDLCESTEKLMKFRGKFQEADAVNKNKRMYPHNILDENMQRLQETIDSSKILHQDSAINTLFSYILFSISYNLHSMRTSHLLATLTIATLGFSSFTYAVNLPPPA
jgi:hypothetical protein